jgi:hypothetical protein
MNESEMYCTRQYSQDRQARDLFICLNTSMSMREAAQIDKLIDELEELLQSANIPFVVLSHGFMTKSSRSFVALEYYGPLPGHILDRLKANPIINSFVIYDAPSLELEQRVVQQALLLEAKQPNQEGETCNCREVPAPPEPPAEFLLLSVPVPLLSVYDERWIARATGPEGTGILIYEHLRKVVFLLEDEAIGALAVLSAEAGFLPCNKEEDPSND